MSNELSIKSVRDVLSQYKIPADQIGDKNGRPYIKWSYALGIFWNHFPQATFEFTQYEQADGTMVDVQYYKDGSCSVECTVRIGDVNRTMWLPVTDFKNKPIGDCFNINTAKMRCLTKCISVCFGLGADIYGMDMLQEISNGGGAEVSISESPIPKQSSVVKPSPSFIEEPDKVERLKGSDAIPVGYNKGDTYSESYGDDVVKVRKDIKYWKPKQNLNDDQKLHLNTLVALEKHIINQQEKRLIK
jgi:hypothetical protein